MPASNETHKREIIETAVKMLGHVDERMSSVIEALDETPGAVHLVVVDGADDDESVITIKTLISREYSVSSIIAATCSLLEQASAVLKSDYEGIDDEQFDCLTQCISTLESNFGITTKDTRHFN
jgi:hypothetical protein